MVNNQEAKKERLVRLTKELCKWQWDNGKIQSAIRKAKWKITPEGNIERNQYANIKQK